MRLRPKPRHIAALGRGHCYDVGVPTSGVGRSATEKTSTIPISACGIPVARSGMKHTAT